MGEQHTSHDPFPVVLQVTRSSSRSFFGPLKLHIRTLPLVVLACCSRELRHKQKDSKTWTLTSVWVISSTHISQLHIWSCPSVPVLCYPPIVLWSPSAQGIIDVKQDEEKNKYRWPTEQCGCALEATINQHKGSAFIASYWFITKYASSANGLFQLPPPLAAIWLMQLHRWASFGLQRSYNEQRFI